MTRFNRALGLFFVLCVAVIWVAGSFIVKDIENDLSPVIVTYIANALFVVFLPFAKIRRWLSERQRLSRAHSDSDDEGQALVEKGSSWGENEKPVHASNVQRSAVTEKEIIVTAAMIAPFWWLAQYFFNASLQMTSVTSNTIISSTASLFTFALSLWFLKEPFALHRLAGLLVCVLGNALVAVSDEDSDHHGAHHQVLGDVLTVIAALLYAIYTVMLRKRFPNDGQVDVPLFFGYMGLILSVIMGILVVLLSCIGVVKTVGLPREALGWAVVKGLLDNVLSDYLWARAVLLIGPTIATVGLLMEWPVAITADLLFKNPDWLHHPLSAVSMISGALLVLFGFIAVNVESATLKSCFGRRTAVQSGGR